MNIWKILILSLIGFLAFSTTQRTSIRYTEPAPTEKLNWLIHLQHVRGDTETCKELIKKEIVNSEGRNEFLFFKQGSILKEEGKVAEALESFQSCLKLNPENTENIKEVGTCLYHLGRYKLALDAYKEAERVTKLPDWQVFHKIAETNLILGEIEPAKHYVRQAIQFGKNESSYVLLVKLLKKQADFKAALGVCKSSTESCPDSVNLLCETGFLHLQMGEYQHAFERLSDALALEPSCSRALLGIGCITQTHGDVDVALSKYKLAIQYEPDSVALWNNIGSCFHSKQKYIAAVSCLKRALWTSPLNWRVLLNLGLVHLSIHQPASAFIFLCAAVNLRSDVPQSFTALGYSLMELQDPENALRACIHASNLSPDIVDHQLNTALTSMRAGNLELLQESLQNVKSLMSSQEHISSECSDLFKYLSKASITVDAVDFTERDDEALQRLNLENVASREQAEAPARQDIHHLNMESDEV